MADCTYNGAAYSEGSLICVNGKELSCYAGVWAETGRACTSIDPSSASVRATQLQISRSAAGPTAPFPPYEYGINVGGTIDRKRVANPLPLYQWRAISGCQRCGSNSATLLAG